LEVTIDGQIQSPRTLLISVPFAETAGNLNCQSPYTSGPIYRTYPFASQISTFGSDGLEQIRLWGEEWGELLLHDNRSGNSLTAVLSAGQNSGGLLILTDSLENPVISLDAGMSGNAAVNLPVDAVSPLETSAEAGIANHVGTNFFTDLTVQNTDYKIDSVTITIPAGGYVDITAGCYVTANHNTGIQTDIFVGISKTQNIDYFVPGCVVIGIADTHPTGVVRVPGYSTRIYSETAGTHTYYLVAERNSGGTPLTNIANPSLTARYFPTAYGNITTTNFDNSPDLPEMPISLIDGSNAFENPFLEIQSLEEMKERLQREIHAAKQEIERFKRQNPQKSYQTQKETIGQSH
jgi:hypothetical protein